MDARLNPYDNAIALKFVKYLNSSGAVVTDSKLPAATQELVKIRASQINGCSGCLDMHTKDAEHRGESPVRPSPGRRTATPASPRYDPWPLTVRRISAR